MEQTCILCTWCVFDRASLHMRREEKPTRCHRMVYFTYNMLNMFRALLCPKHVEHIISAINHSVTSSWFFFSTCILCVNEVLHFEIPITMKCRILFETEPTSLEIFSDGFICKLKVAEWNISATRFTGVCWMWRGESSGSWTTPSISPSVIVARRWEAIWVAEAPAKSVTSRHEWRPSL